MGVSTVYEGERHPTLHDIDLTVSAGEFVTIVGPNGAGKTTLLEVVLGLLPPSSGSGRVFGLDVRRSRYAIRRRTGYVIQNFELDPLAPFLTRDIVMTGRSGRLGPLRFPGEEDWRTVDAAMEAVGVSRMARRPAGKLSGGEFQRVLLARAIAKGPDLLLLDEPFANLDLSGRSDIARLIDRLNAGGTTVLMVSHDVSAIPDRCTRAVLMDRGRIIADGGRDEILSSPMLHDLYGGSWR